MSSTIKDRRLFLSVASVVVMAVAARPGEASSIDTFTAMGSQQVASLSVDGATITGSNTLNIDPKNGLSVVGGMAGSDGPGGTIDPTESITIDFAKPSTGIVVTFATHGTFGTFPDSQAGEYAVQAFGPTGKSLGTLDLIPDHDIAFNGQSFYTTDLSTALTFYIQPISSLRITPIGTTSGGATLSLGELSFTDAPAPVPEPSSILVAITIVAAGVYHRRSTRRNTDSKKSLRALAT
jgi:hypothetical protein